jgi:hypothetical protein
MDGKVHFGLLGREEFIICSCYVRVNGMVPISRATNSG